MGAAGPRSGKSVSSNERPRDGRRGMATTLSGRLSEAAPSQSVQAGESGNPRGRPKRTASFPEMVAEEMNGLVPVMENGVRKKISRKRAAARSLAHRAATGDDKAIKSACAYEKEALASSTGPQTIEVTMVFDEEENRLVELAEENARLRAEISDLRGQLRIILGPDIAANARARVSPQGWGDRAETLRNPRLPCRSQIGLGHRVSGPLGALGRPQ